MSEINDGGAAFPVCPGQEGLFFDKFIARVDMRGGDIADCWEWTGAKTPKGYGVFSYSKNGQMRAHRYAFLAYNGREPREMVLHKCDNPSCVNPHHLEDGDHGENMRQMAERRRAAREDRHHKAKLKFCEAAAVVLLHRGGGYTTRELAEMLGMSQPTIAAITKGDLWPDAYAIADAMLAARKEPTT